MKKIIIALAIILCCFKAEATQILHSSGASTQGASLTRYLPAMGYSSSIYTSDGAASQIMPAAGVIDSLVVRLSGTAGSNRVFTLYKNGSGTALTCTVTAAATTCTDVSNSVSYAAGDTISMEVVTVASGSTRNQTFSLRFVPTTEKQSILTMVSNAANYTNAHYAALTGSISSNATETNVSTILPETATISKMYVSVDTAPGVGTSVTFTSRNNGSNGNLTCTISDTNTSCNDTSHTDTIATAGNTFGTVISVSGSPTAAPFKVSYVYTTPTCGNFPIPEGGAGTALSTTATRYVPVIGVRAPASGEVIGDNQQVSNAFTMKSVVTLLSAAPGSGKSYAFTLRNGSDTALVNTISDTTTLQTASTDVAISSGNLLSTSSVPTNTPTGPLYKAAYIGNVSTDSCSGGGGSRRAGFVQ